MVSGYSWTAPSGRAAVESLGGSGDGRLGAVDVVVADVAIEDLVSERDLAPAASDGRHLSVLVVERSAGDVAVGVELKVHAPFEVFEEHGWRLGIQPVGVLAGEVHGEPVRGLGDRGGAAEEVVVTDVAGEAGDKAASVRWAGGGSSGWVGSRRWRPMSSMFLARELLRTTAAV